MLSTVEGTRRGEALSTHLEVLVPSRCGFMAPMAPIAAVIAAAMAIQSGARLLPSPVKAAVAAVAVVAAG